MSLQGGALDVTHSALCLDIYASPVCASLPPPPRRTWTDLLRCREEV